MKLLDHLMIETNLFILEKAIDKNSPFSRSEGFRQWLFQTWLNNIISAISEWFECAWEFVSSESKFPVLATPLPVPELG